MSDTEKSTPKQEDVKNKQLSASSYADVKGFDNLRRFAITRMFPDKSYTESEWDKIVVDHKLIDAEKKVEAPVDKKSA